MPNKRSGKNCVEIRVCVGDDLEANILRFQNIEAGRTGKRPYHKNEAASDFFERLNKFANHILPEKEKA